MSAGGAERVAASLAQAWAERHWEITIITLAPKSVDFYALHPNVSRVALNLSGASTGLIDALWTNMKRVHAVRKQLREIRPDMVLSMMSSACVIAILAALGLGIRVIATEHTFPRHSSISKLWDWLRRTTYPHAYRVVMLTPEGLQWLHQCIPKANGAVIPNPIPFPLPGSKPKLFPDAYSGKGRSLILAIGRLDDGKQFDHLLDAFARLFLRHPEWDLVILGEGPERAALEREVLRLELVGRAFLPGHAGNVGDWYERADLFVLTSRYEGFGNTLAEAMSYGCAAVSYDCDAGPRNIVNDGVDGLLISPVGDVPALSRALDRLMYDEPERKRLATNAIAVRDRFSIVRILALWDDLFESSQ